MDQGASSPAEQETAQEDAQPGQPSLPSSLLLLELWLVVIGYLGQDTAVRILPRVHREFWHLLREPSRIWRNVELRDLVGPAMSGPNLWDQMRYCTAAGHWLRARSAAVESLTIDGVQFKPTCVILAGVLGGALPALNSFKLRRSQWEGAVLERSNLSWLCEQLGRCSSLQALELRLDFSRGVGDAVEWAQLRDLTSLCFDHYTGVNQWRRFVPVPACVLGLPRLHALVVGHVSQLCFEDWACRSELQTLRLYGCLPAERGYALQALPALTFLSFESEEHLSFEGAEGQQLDRARGRVQLPCGLRELHLTDFRAGHLTPDIVASVRASLRVLRLTALQGFPAEVTGLRNLRRIDLAFAGDLHVPAELRACAKLETLTFDGREAGLASNVHLEQLDLRSFPSMQELRFTGCTLFCTGPLVHAAHLPLLRLVQFSGALPAPGESAEAVGELELALQGLGKAGVLRF